MSDLTTTRIFTDGERGITAQKLNDIVGSSTIQPAFYSSKPTAPSADPSDIALILKAGAYAQVPISALAGSATQAQIWDTRLRSYNAIGNPNFEVDQRNVGSVISNPVSGTFCTDRWIKLGSGTYQVNFGQFNSTLLLPGTNYRIGSKQLNASLLTSQAVLGVGDILSLHQTAEGVQFRELANDVHSITLLVYSDTAPLKFSVALRDPSSAHSLVKLCTIPVPNTWTLVQLPNLPVFPGAGNWSVLPGVQGYDLSINLAVGSTFIAPAADVWQNGNFIGAPGMDNWTSKLVGSTFVLGFVQHEPGPLCTTLMDKPFNQNLDECLRYYCSSYPFGWSAGSAIFSGMVASFMCTGSAANADGWAPFPKRMAKTPTVMLYEPTTGQAGLNYDMATGLLHFANADYISDTGFFRHLSTQTPSDFIPGHSYGAQYTADTGW